MSNTIRIDFDDEFYNGMVRLRASMLRHGFIFMYYNSLQTTDCIINQWTYIKNKTNVVVTYFRYVVGRGYMFVDNNYI